MPYKNIEDARAQKRRWSKTPVAKILRSRYKKSLKGKACSKRYRTNLKKEILRVYGQKCACCGEFRFEFLGIDHINGGGRNHRKQLGIHGGWNFYQWLRNKKFPKGYQVLCHNCNLSLGCFGYCPHNT